MSHFYVSYEKDNMYEVTIAIMHIARTTFFTKDNCQWVNQVPLCMLQEGNMS